MASLRMPARPTSCVKCLFRQIRYQKAQQRLQSTAPAAVANPNPGPPKLFHSKPTRTGKTHKPIPVFPPPPSYRRICREPLKTFQEQQLATLDPTGARRRLFSKENPEAAKVGDILLVRTNSGEPFAGVCINIRKRGVDTAILLRNHLTRVGVEMWFKIYSPSVTGIEVVQRREKRARRARLYYMRQPKHDIGSVDGIVRQYLRQRAALGASGTARSGNVKGRDANANKKKSNKRGSN